MLCRFGDRLRKNTDPDFICRALVGAAGETDDTREAQGAEVVGISREVVELSASWLINAISVDVDAILRRIPSLAICHLLLITVDKLVHRCEEYDVWNEHCRGFGEDSMVLYDADIMFGALHVDGREANGRLISAQGILPALLMGDEHRADSRLLLASADKLRRILLKEQEEEEVGEEDGADSRKILLAEQEGILAILMNDFASPFRARRVAARLALGYMIAIQDAHQNADDVMSAPSLRLGPIRNANELMDLCSAEVQALLQAGPDRCKYLDFSLALSKRVTGGAVAVRARELLVDALCALITVESSPSLALNALRTLKSIDCSRSESGANASDDVVADGANRALEAMVHLLSSQPARARFLVSKMDLGELEDCLRPLFQCFPVGAESPPTQSCGEFVLPQSIVPARVVDESATKKNEREVGNAAAPSQNEANISPTHSKHGNKYVNVTQSPWALRVDALRAIVLSAFINPMQRQSGGESVEDDALLRIACSALQSLKAADTQLFLSDIIADVRFAESTKRNRELLRSLTSALSVKIVMRMLKNIVGFSGCVLAALVTRLDLALNGVSKKESWASLVDYIGGGNSKIFKKLHSELMSLWNGRSHHQSDPQCSSGDAGDAGDGEVVEGFDAERSSFLQYIFTLHTPDTLRAPGSFLDASADAESKMEISPGAVQAEHKEDAEVEVEEPSTVHDMKSPVAPIKLEQPLVAASVTPWESLLRQLDARNTTLALQRMKDFVLTWANISEVPDLWMSSSSKERRRSIGVFASAVLQRTCDKDLQFRFSVCDLLHNLLSQLNDVHDMGWQDELIRSLFSHSTEVAGAGGEVTAGLDQFFGSSATKHPRRSGATLDDDLLVMTRYLQPVLRRGVSAIDIATTALEHATTDLSSYNDFLAASRLNASVASSEGAGLSLKHLCSTFLGVTSLCHRALNSFMSAKFSTSSTSQQHCLDDAGIVGPVEAVALLSKFIEFLSTVVRFEKHLWRRDGHWAEIGRANHIAATSAREINHTLLGTLESGNKVVPTVD